MTRIADIKMAVLAVLIVLTSVLCSQNDDKLAEARPILLHAPLTESQRLTG